MLHEYLSDAGSSKGVTKRHKMGILSEGIHYDQNTIGIA